MDAKNVKFVICSVCCSFIVFNCKLAVCRFKQCKAAAFFRLNELTRHLTNITQFQRDHFQRLHFQFTKHVSRGSPQVHKYINRFSKRNFRNSIRRRRRSSVFSGSDAGTAPSGRLSDGVRPSGREEAAVRAEQFRPGPPEMDGFFGIPEGRAERSLVSSRGRRLSRGAERFPDKFRMRPLEIPRKYKVCRTFRRFRPPRGRAARGRVGASLPR